MAYRTRQNHKQSVPSGKASIFSAIKERGGQTVGFSTSHGERMMTAKAGSSVPGHQIAQATSVPHAPTALTKHSPHARPPQHAGPRAGKTFGSRGGGRSRGTRHNQRPTGPNTFRISIDKEKTPPIPPVGENIRIIPLGGVEEIGKNMTAVEIGNDIIVIDAGFQFRDEETPGIDYILPNTRYLEERKDRVRAIIITHGHLDHIGAIPYIMDKIGNPPLYSRMLTTVMIKKRQEEFPHLPQIDIKVVEKNDRVKIGTLSVRFFSVTHTIPDAMGILIETPYGLIVHTGDLKLDHENGIPSEMEEEEYAQFKNEKVLVLLADSTNVELPGFSTPEKVVHKNIDAIIKNTNGRLIIGTFASLLERIMKIIEYSEKYGKKVVVEGRSMKNNIEIIRHLGILKCKSETLITSETMDQYPPERIVVLATGAQGDEFAALMRMSNKTHKYFKINKRDTILLSSSIIPGNERAVQKLKDNLSRQGARIIHYRVADVHSSGHANRDETAWIHSKINPKFFIPIHGYHYMLRVHADIEIARGTPEDRIVIPDNGMIIEITDKGEKIKFLKEKAPGGLVLVDGFSVGDIQDVVIRDRQMLAQDGMFVIIASIDVQTGKLRKSPDIISRGFVYLRESQELLREARFVIKKVIEKSTAGMKPLNFDYVKDNVTDEVSKFLLQKTAKRPIVIPVVLGI